MRKAVTALEPLGVAVRQSRLRHGWTQEELAQKARVSRVFVSNLERGRGPRAELTRVLNVIRALGLELFVDEPDANVPKSFDEALESILQ